MIHIRNLGRRWLGVNSNLYHNFTILPKNSSILSFHLRTLSSSSSSSINPSPTSSPIEKYNEVLFSAFRKRNVRLADSIYNEILANQLAPSLETFELLISTYSTTNELDKAFSSFQAMVSSHSIKPSLDIYVSMLELCCREGQNNKFDSLWRQLHSDGYTPDLDIYKALLSAYAESGQLNRMMETYESLKAADIEPDTEIINTLFSMTMRAQAVQKGWSLLRDASKYSLPTFFAHYSELIRVASEVSDLPTTLSIFRDLTSLNYRPNNVTYGYLVASAARANEKQLAFQMYAEVKRLTRKPTYDTFFALLRLCNSTNFGSSPNSPLSPLRFHSYIPKIWSPLDPSFTINADGTTGTTSASKKKRPKRRRHAADHLIQSSLEDLSSFPSPYHPQSPPSSSSSSSNSNLIHDADVEGAFTVFREYAKIYPSSDPPREFIEELFYVTVSARSTPRAWSVYYHLRSAFGLPKPFIILEMGELALSQGFLQAAYTAVEHLRDAIVARHTFPTQEMLDFQLRVAAATAQEPLIQNSLTELVATGYQPSTPSLLRLLPYHLVLETTVPAILSTAISQAEYELFSQSSLAQAIDPWIPNNILHWFISWLLSTPSVHSQRVRPFVGPLPRSFDSISPSHAIPPSSIQEITELYIPLIEPLIIERMKDLSPITLSLYQHLLIAIDAPIPLELSETSQKSITEHHSLLSLIVKKKQPQQEEQKID